MPVSSMLVMLFKNQSSNFIPSPLVELRSFIKQIDMFMQIWSNERYGSVEHRVKVNSEKERFSIAYFLNPAHYIGRTAYSLGKFITQRKLTNLKIHNTENIQIYHFREPD
ncbi:hypothetical protein D8674_003977 [Pyrus ussuriensis x Pyrus communis]|uniref:Isopenicillin N synthase-like Fe(2+) 2OG dioxygenase domain-containing protein n=1 Tax=Pyrus ussuriensis x Pyrus communis TaxID=2448454 RepID=A0A5N5FP04_9ROSA|nr:hypothetical protein D8674_003977 [Pyrus ussuriensis x Pyrus communis]